MFLDRVLQRGERKPRTVTCGAGYSILLGEHDGEDTQRRLGIGRIFRPELSGEIVVVDLPEQLFALELERVRCITPFTYGFDFAALLRGKLIDGQKRKQARRNHSAHAARNFPDYGAR